MKTEKSSFFFMGLLLAASLGISGCRSQETPAADAVSSASMVYYENSSFNREQLWESIKKAEGGCTIATVNKDGTPDLIIAVPSTAGDSHIFFNWADNETKSNVNRTGTAVISYFVYNPNADKKEERNKGARLKLALERDKTVLLDLEKENPACSSSSTVFRIEELLPLG